MANLVWSRCRSEERRGNSERRVGVSGYQLCCPTQLRNQLTVVSSWE